VRKLADQSRHAAQEISELIAVIQAETANTVTLVQEGARQTEEGVSVVQQTRTAFGTIGSSVRDMTARIEQIADVSQQIADNTNGMLASITETAAVAEQSSAATQQVSASTDQTTASTQQIAASASQLATSAEHLNQLVGRFKTAT